MAKQGIKDSINTKFDILNCNIVRTSLRLCFFYTNIYNLVQVYKTKEDKKLKILIYSVKIPSKMQNCIKLKFYQNAETQRKKNV